MKFEREKIGVALAATFAFGVSSAFSADALNVMAVGDSLTWGFSYEGPDGILGNADDGGSANWFAANGGWRDPLQQQLNSNISLGQTYNFIGVKGDDNPTTVANEKTHQTDSRVPGYADGDGLDGPGNTASLHHGYGGWLIDATPYSGLGADTDGIRQNISADGSTGAIQPGSAEVIMLMIGVNDIISHVYGNTAYNATGTSGMVDNLAGLIDEIAALAPDSTILVSNLLPVVTNTLPFTGADLTNETNLDISAFNDELLLDEFGNTWLDDSEGTDVYAEHDTHDNVFLLNAHSAINPSAAGGDIYTIYNDNIHLTPGGYSNLADFYEDRFVGLNVVPSPSSAAVLAVLGGMAMCRRRRAC